MRRELGASDLLLFKGGESLSDEQSGAGADGSSYSRAWHFMV